MPDIEQVGASVVNGQEIVVAGQTDHEEQKDNPVVSKEEEEEFTMFEDSQRKDTFVGTPLYVSPEMLQENISLPAGDVWALGCIIFRMHTGRTPFAGISEV